MARLIKYPTWVIAAVVLLFTVPSHLKSEYFLDTHIPFIDISEHPVITCYLIINDFEGMQSIAGKEKCAEYGKPDCYRLSVHENETPVEDLQYKSFQSLDKNTEVLLVQYRSAFPEESVRVLHVRADISGSHNLEGDIFYFIPGVNKKIPVKLSSTQSFADYIQKLKADIPAGKCRTDEEIHFDPKDIVDFYLAMPKLEHSYREKENFREVRKKNLIPGENREVTVDLKNAYLQINFAEELAEKITLTYFRKADGGTLIALSEYYEGGDCSYYYITCYEYKSHAWTDVTSEVLPQISLNCFRNKNNPFPSEQYIDYDANINWEYNLPRHGTTIEVRPVALDTLLCFEPQLQNGNYWENWEQMERVMSDYYKDIHWLGNNFLELKFNRSEGIFEILSE